MRKRTKVLAAVGALPIAAASAAAVEAGPALADDPVNQDVGPATPEQEQYAIAHDPSVTASTPCHAITPAAATQFGPFVFYGTTQDCKGTTVLLHAADPANFAANFVVAGFKGNRVHSAHGPLGAHVMWTSADGIGNSGFVTIKCDESICFTQ
jgi:hypothetical protein